jgi:allantoin racemase
MSMRIWHQSFTVLDDLPAYRDRVRQHIDQVKRSDTQVDMHGLLPQTYPSNYPGGDLGYNFLFGLHGMQFPAAALKAAKEGYDAFALCTLFDPYLQEIRTIVDIPVVATGEASFHIARMCGTRFGMLLFMDRVIPRYQDQIRLAGLSDSCAGVRQTGQKFDDVLKAFGGSPGPFIDRFRQVARELIAAGADVIIPGETPMSVLFATEGFNRVDDVPLVDTLAVTIKMTELFVDLKRATGLSHSRHGFYNAAPPPERTAAVMDFYYRNSPLSSTHE